MNLSHFPGSMQDTPFTFLGLPDPEGGLGEARVCILPIPYESTTTYRGGTRSGPAAIVDASRYVETYDEETLCDLADIPILTLPGVSPLLGAAEAMSERIRDVAREVVSPDRLLISLGGEHAITAPLVEAHLEKFGHLTVVHLDAHADLRESYEGSRMSHASVIKRVAEHTDVLSVGVRSISSEEMHWLRNQQRVRVIFAHEIRSDQSLLERALGELRGNVYLTIDVDVLDPGVMPGVGTPEPGGLSYDQVVHVIKRLTKGCSIVGADLVELAPVPGNVVSEFTAARIVAKIVAYTKKPAWRSVRDGKTQ